jgi:maleylpyruvate isomerase
VRVFVLDSDLRSVEDAHRRFLRSTGSLGDHDVRRPSRLPGWTVAHVLTHLARNADSHIRRSEAALRGEMVDQYEGGTEGRAAQIEAGAIRDAADLIADVRETADALEEIWRQLPADAWLGRSRDVSGSSRYLFELPARRWQEVEVHLVDLGVGITSADWSDTFVREWLPRTRDRFKTSTSSDLDFLRFAGPAEELAWLYGRLERSDLPSAPPWG